MIKDKNDKILKTGDYFDIHQTVNGCNLFYVNDIETLDIRYAFDLEYKYQYDVNDLFKPCQFTGEVVFEIINYFFTEKRNILKL